MTRVRFPLPAPIDKYFIMRLYEFAAAQKPFIYFTQCDRMRTLYAHGEDAWHRMMRERKCIADTKVDRLCDLTGLLDPDETLEDFVSSDPEYGCYSSNLLGHECIFIQHSGFEFIFVRVGEIDQVKVDLNVD